MKLREYIEQEYNKTREEYNQNKIQLKEEYNKIINKIEETAKEYDIEPYEINFSNCAINEIWLRQNDKRLNPYFTTYYSDIWEDEYIVRIPVDSYNKCCKKQELLRQLLTRTKEILENKEQYIAINKKQLGGFVKYKNIEILEKVGEYNSCSSTDGNLDGCLSGSKAFGFGSIGGNIKGKLKSNSSEKYEEELLIKFTYDLDYEIEDYILENMTLEKTINILESEVN